MFTAPSPTCGISEYSSWKTPECLHNGMGVKVGSASPGPVVISYTSALSHGMTQYLHCVCVFFQSSWQSCKHIQFSDQARREMSVPVCPSMSLWAGFSRTGNTKAFCAFRLYIQSAELWSLAWIQVTIWTSWHKNPKQSSGTNLFLPTRLLASDVKQHTGKHCFSRKWIDF